MALSALTVPPPLASPNGRPSFLRILPGRVRRNYTGGALLETWSGLGEGRDGDRPEDWMASTTEAVNPGLPPLPGEGRTLVERPDATVVPLAGLLPSDPAYYLGETHLRNRGAELGFLAKLLDSAIRLHVQAHPTANFARRHLGSRYGKFETYVILAIREGSAPKLRLGFQRSPGRDGWRRIIEEQDLAAMEACFDEIPLRVGEVWCVPGGMPHAIGGGVLMLEVMEPSDLVVRCEFERDGLVVPPAGRFMGRGLDFCLELFDYQSRSVVEIQDTCRITPRPLGESGEEELIGPGQTPCFSVRRQTVSVPTPLRCDTLEVLLVVHGQGILKTSSGTVPLDRAGRFIIPAGAEDLLVTPAPGHTLELLKIRPNSSSPA